MLEKNQPHISIICLLQVVSYPSGDVLCRYTMSFVPKGRDPVLYKRMASVFEARALYVS